MGNVLSILPHVSSVILRTVSKRNPKNIITVSVTNTILRETKVGLARIVVFLFFNVAHFNFNNLKHEVDTMTV